MMIDTIESQIEDVITCSLARYLNSNTLYLKSRTIRYNGGRQSGHTTTMIELLKRYPNSLGLVNTHSIAMRIGKTYPDINNRIFSWVSFPCAFLGSRSRFNMVIIDDMHRMSKDDEKLLDIEILISPVMTHDEPFVLIKLQ